jgi:hypothetical protein
MLPFQQHAAITRQYQDFIGGGSPLATLLLYVNPNVTVPLTHTKIDGSFFLTGGQSDTTTIERCEFQSCLIPMTNWKDVKKGLCCDLTIKPGAPVLQLRLWDGGLVEGGETFRFMLVGVNFRG